MRRKQPASQCYESAQRLAVLLRNMNLQRAALTVCCETAVQAGAQTNIAKPDSTHAAELLNFVFFLGSSVQNEYRVAMGPTNTETFKLVLLP